MKPSKGLRRCRLLRRSAGMGARGTLVHRSKIVLGVLVIIFRGDPVAASGLGLRQRQITVIVSTRILRRLALGAAEFGRIGVLPRSFRHSSRHCVGFHFLFGSDCAAAPCPEVIVIALHPPRQPKPRGIRSRKWLDAVGGALRQGDRTSMAPAGNELGA